VKADAPHPSNRWVIVGAIIGNALEWFDFTVFGLFVPYIAKAFFPSGDELASLLLTFATFGIGFIPRPIGAIVLGHYADRAGRRAALTLIIVIMTIGTALIAIAPGYAHIGIAAPVVILVARLLQGFSAGGEMGGATAFLIESAPLHRRGLYASWQFAGQAGAALFGSLIATVLTHALTAGQLESWGWRLPFLLGLAIGPVGLYLRSSMSDSAEFLAARARPGIPLFEVWRNHRGALAQAFGITILLTAGSYLILFYMPTYAVRQLGLAPRAAFTAATIASLLYLLVNPLAGRLSDSIGRVFQLRLVAILMLVMAYPLYRWLDLHPTLGALIFVQGALATLLASFSGPAASTIGELFPARVRSTGLSVGYNVAVPIFGGFAPLYVAPLAVSHPLAPAYYLVACAILTIATLLSLPLVRQRDRRNAST